jgi:hypothetical protein
MITLESHIGINIATKLPVELKQDRIYLDGKHVGYVGWQPGAPINLIVRGLPAAIVDDVRAAVAAKHGAGERKLAVPPEIPAEVLAAQAEEDDTDVDA